jgi:hypothetical protein
MSASKCFIDANLFIYALTESALPADQPKRERAPDFSKYRRRP